MQVSDTWWKTFFSGMFNESWKMLRTEQNTRQEADFIESILPHPSARILDVPCGAGRLAVELARRGHHVTGVDLCEEFLDEARATAAERQLEIILERREMRDLPWSERFDAAICCGTSFGFLGEPGDFEFAVAVHRALRPGGVFLIDTTKLLEITFMPFKPRGWARLSDIVLTYEHQYDLETGVERTDYEFFRNGEGEQKSCQQRIYTYHELSTLIRNAGFDGHEGYSSLDRKPVRVGLQRLLFVAKKAEPASSAL